MEQNIKKKNKLLGSIEDSDSLVRQNTLKRVDPYFQAF